MKNVLCVDLDGTFIKSDMLVESFTYCFLRNPFIIFCCVYWLVSGGKGCLKRNLSKRYNFRTELIPLNAEILELIKLKKSQNYQIYLVSASYELIVKNFYQCYNYLFDGYFATTDQSTNLSGCNKANFLMKTFPDGFEYVGNSSEDIHVWNKSAMAYCYSNDDAVLEKILVSKTRILPEIKSNIVSLILKQIRFHQWTKNLLICLPAIAIHKILPVSTYLMLFLSILSFSFIASSVYIINDLIDLDSDRSHLSKRNRPIASCELTLLDSYLLLIGVFLLGVLSAYFVSPIFLCLVLLYLVVNILYSLKLKSIEVFDCIVLATMYTYRIFLGNIVCTLSLSVWMISFSFFIFLSLAFVKRYTELYNAKTQNHEVNKSRGYLFNDMPIILILAVTSGFLSVLVYNLYLNDNDIKEQFNAIWYAYLSIPILLYWLSRIYMLTARGKMNEDPVAFALKDKGSILIGLIFVLLFIIGAVYPW